MINKDSTLHDCMQHFTSNKTGKLDLQLPRLQVLTQHQAKQAPLAFNRHKKGSMYVTGCLNFAYAPYECICSVLIFGYAYILLC
jgi:hypothetical protein